MYDGMIPVKAPTPKPGKARLAYSIAQLTGIALIRPNVSLDGQAKSDTKKPAARWDKAIFDVLDVLSFAAALLCIPQRPLDLNEQEIHADSTTTVA
ncbi:unnamed protein product [Alternaria sp. RS040]